MAPPLAGIKVLELARVLAGPWAGQLLADLGADVIKIERPGTGDDTRAWGPPFVEGKGGENLSSAYYHAINRNKRSVTVDFKKDDDRALLLTLAGEADVLIENYKVGDLKKYGLDYASLEKTNPRLIYCSVTGFGQDGPYAHRPGYDFVVQGMSGIMDITGEADGMPQKPGVAFADVFTGVYSALAIEAALIARARTGEGQYIDMALLDVQTSVLANQALYYLVSGTPPRRLGNEHATVVPFGVFPASDGHIIITGGNDGQFRGMCTVLGIPEIADDRRFVTNAARVENRLALREILFAATRKHPRDKLAAELEKAGVPVGPINDIAGAFADPQIKHRKMRVDLAEEVEGGVIVPGVRTPITMSETPLRYDRPSPRLGSDDTAVRDAVRAGRSAFRSVG
ncbi:MAG TPA: CaiB/BaiF CoA-transferase family protein [Xanthobacteraceae bacterium]|nr:CaiB/BaiF CoA-transferase family protein [Xanthobacteraceae bacterium]